MSEYIKLFTSYGLEKQTKCLYDGTDFEVAHISIGDANGAMYEPSVSQTALVNQRHVLAITENYSNENIHQFFARIPDDIDDYIIREVGLLDREGNLLWVSQFNMSTHSEVENVVTENIIGIQIELNQGTTVSLVDGNIQLATRKYVLENFQQYIERGVADGYCPLDSNALIPKAHLPELGFEPVKYSIAEGNLDSKGNLDLINAQVAINENKEYKEAGTYTVEITTDGIYHVELVGAGGGGAWGSAYNGMAPHAGGGSGAAFVGDIFLTAGSYTINVGGIGNGVYGVNASGGSGKNTTLQKDGDEIISAGGGGGGSQWVLGVSGGAAGVLTISEDVNVDSYTVRTNGNAGGANYNSNVGGGASVYNGYGYGGGDGASGGVGYFCIVLTQNGSDYIDYKVSVQNPLTLVKSSGDRIKIEGINRDAVAVLDNGTYHKFIDDNGSELLKNNLYYQNYEPVSPSLNDVWVKIGEPLEVFKYDGENWQNYTKILIGTFSINQGQIVSFENAKLFENSFNLTTFNKKNIMNWSIPDYSNGITVTATSTEQSFKCPSDGFICFSGGGFNGGYSYLKINGAIINNATTLGNSFITNVSAFAFASKGDICLYKDSYNSSGYGHFFIFYPLKGDN